MNLPILASVWFAAGGAAFFIVKVFKIGPIIYTFSAEHGWGLHSGDFLALIPLGIALTLTVLLRKPKSA